MSGGENTPLSAKTVNPLKDVERCIMNRFRLPETDTLNSNGASYAFTLLAGVGWYHRQNENAFGSTKPGI